jgi:anti-sigma factor RsiW
MNGDDDALLVAFIDRELDESARHALEARLAADADLRARLTLLQNGGRPFAPAFQALLDEAPVERLKAAIAAFDPREAPPVRRSPTFRLSRLGIAAAIVLFCAGIAIGRYAPAWLAPSRLEATASANGQQEDWRQSVAEYMALYTSDTFETAAGGQEGVLTAIGAKVGLELKPERIALANLQFKGAQILSFDGAPLGELGYVDAATGPVLFCIINSSEPDAAMIAEKRRGFAVMSWAQAGRGYMLIGRLPANKMAGLADSLRRRF